MSQAAVARQVAFDILRRVAAGAHAADLLVQLTASLDSRDAGLAAEITLGVLRRQGQLDSLIAQFSRTPLAKLDPEILTGLRMALYQLTFLDRVPAHAAVNDTLNLLHGRAKPAYIGFANAILRNFTRKSSLEAAREPAPETAVPAWLLEKWSRDLGAEAADAVAIASLAVPLTYQHVPPGIAPPEGAIETGVPGCFEVAEPDPRFRVQDIGSQAIVPLLALSPEDRFLDLCAAPGNKTAQALDITCRVIAADISFKRLGLLSTRPPRAVLDATRPLPFTRCFTKILVDAPCSGTGTLAHNPEIKWRLTAQQIEQFPHRQKLILRNALEVLAPGGTLVYSTCSLEPEENEQVARDVAAGRVEQEIRRLPGREPGDGFYAAVIR